MLLKTGNGVYKLEIVIRAGNKVFRITPVGSCDDEKSSLNKKEITPGEVLIGNSIALSRTGRLNIGNDEDCENWIEVDPSPVEIF